MKLFATNSRLDGELPLAQEIIQVADDFAEFNSVNAFLCCAFTAVMSSHEPIREEVIQGARHCSASLQARAQELKDSLYSLGDRYQA